MNTACHLFSELIISNLSDIQSIFFTTKYTKETKKGYEVRGMGYEVSGGAVPCCSWGMVSSRKQKAESRKHFLYFRSHNALRGAMSAGGADAAVRWDSCRLDFFAYFFYQEKKYEKNI